MSSFAPGSIAGSQSDQRLEIDGDPVGAAFHGDAHHISGEGALSDIARKVVREALRAIGIDGLGKNGRGKEKAGNDRQQLAHSTLRFRAAAWRRSRIFVGNCAPDGKLFGVRPLLSSPAAPPPACPMMTRSAARRSAIAASAASAVSRNNGSSILRCAAKIAYLSQTMSLLPGRHRHDRRAGRRRRLPDGGVHEGGT